MSDAPAPADVPVDSPAEGTEAKPVEADPKVALNDALKRAGVKLKAKDKEYVPRDIDDLTNKANRVFGLESEIEGFKKEKSEADAVKKWRAAIEADDDTAAEAAFDSLSPKAQNNAAKWLEKKARAWEEQQKLPPEALRAQQMLEQRERELQQFRQRDAEQKQEAERQQHARELRETSEGVLKVAKGVFDSLKVDIAKAPRAPAALTPILARHMRVAMMAEAETGAPVDPLEIQENVRQEVVQSFGAVAEGMADDALYDTLGPALVKRLLTTHGVRKGVLKPGNASTAGATPANGVKPKEKDPRFGTPAYFRGD